MTDEKFAKDLHALAFCPKPARFRGRTTKTVGVARASRFHLTRAGHIKNAQFQSTGSEQMNEHRCLGCNLIFPSRASLRNHSKYCITHKVGKGFTSFCALCNLRILNAVWKDHMARYHPKSASTPVEQASGSEVDRTHLDEEHEEG